MPDNENRSLPKRLLSRIEPALQHDGFTYTVLFIFMLFNISFFILGAGPAWTSSLGDPFILRAAFAIARGGGVALNFNSALVILLAARSLMTWLRSTVLNMIIPFDKAMPAFHSFVGTMLTIATFLHALGHIIRYSILRLATPGFLGTTSLAISGSIITLIVFAMRFTSMVSVRRKSFEAFYWVHKIGFILYFVILIMHGSHKGVLKTWMYVTPPLVIYIIDRGLRQLREKGSRLVLHKDSAVLKGSDMVRLSLKRCFPFRAGQYCDLKVPLVSNLQWHPFTIASSPHENDMVFFIKVSGDWTRRLYALIKERDGDLSDIQVHVRGPYGAPAQHVDQYEHVVLVSGGIGATPFTSITKYAHNYIMNYTERGAEASKTASAAFTRNQSVQGTATNPHTPGVMTGNATPHQQSGFSSAGQRSRNYSRNMSRNFSRPLSRKGSRPISRSLSRSGSGRLDRPDSGGFKRADSGQIEQRVQSSGSRGVLSSRSIDSVGIIINEQRSNFPSGPPSFRRENSRSRSYAIPGSPHSSGDRLSYGIEAHQPSLSKSLSSEINPDMGSLHDYAYHAPDETAYPVPDDYDEDLGNPDAPIPDRNAPPRPGFEIVREYDSSKGLFDDEEEEVEETTVDLPDVKLASIRKNGALHLDIQALSRDGVGQGTLVEDFEIGPYDDDDDDEVGLELEIAQEQGAASNAMNMLGMSFGPNAMLRYLQGMDQKTLRSSMVRASMNLMDDAMDATVWEDRMLFYLHTVTVNWLLLWLMLIRFTLVTIGTITSEFKLAQTGLAVYSSDTLNIIDLILSIVVAIPVIGTIILELYTTSFNEFLGKHVANSFDFFVLVPIQLMCIILDLLHFANVGEETTHASKLTVFLIWPILSMFLLWRISRTIGSRVILAQYFRSTHALTKSLDYILVSKTHEDDSWLIEELLPLTESNIVRLHRFITRHGEKTEPWMLDYERLPIKTTYNRPEWDEVFRALVERSKSGTVIGVFFCGPDKMAHAVQQAAMKAMAKSVENAYQRGYEEDKHSSGQSHTIGSGTNSVRGSRGLRNNGNVGGGVIRRTKTEKESNPAAYGCSVRIVVRIENFT